MTITSPPSVTRTANTRAHRSTLDVMARMYLTEMRLFSRESSVLVFVFCFPVVTSLILGGVFGTDTDDSGFEFINPSHFYTTAYFGVVLAAIGVIMLPVRVAGYRERGVLRRFDTAGIERWVFPATQFLAGLTFAVLGSAMLLLTGALTSGVPAMVQPARAVMALTLSALAMVSVGVALGMLLPSARAAQALGLTLFFPMFMLAGGGPPPEVLTQTMRDIGNLSPLSHVIRSIQEPWFGLANGTNHLVVVLGTLVVSTAVWLWRSGFVSRRD